MSLRGRHLSEQVLALTHFSCTASPRGPLRTRPQVGTHKPNNTRFFIIQAAVFLFKPEGLTQPSPGQSEAPPWVGLAIDNGNLKGCNRFSRIPTPVAAFQAAVWREPIPRAALRYASLCPGLGCASLSGCTTNSYVLRTIMKNPVILSWARPDASGRHNHALQPFDIAQYPRPFDWAQDFRLRFSTANAPKASRPSVAGSGADTGGAGARAAISS